MADGKERVMNKEFWIRLRSSILILLITLLCFYFGGIALFLMIAVVSVIGMFELYRVCGIWKTGLAAAGIAGGCLYLEAVYLGWDAWLLLVLILGLMLVIGTYVFTFPRYQIEQIAVTVFGILYIPVMLSYGYRIRTLEGGRILIWLVFLAASGSDIMAYCTGILFGKHKLAPLLSPKKSVEGSVGGVLGAGLLGLIYALIFRDSLTGFQHPLLENALLCAVGGLVSQLGDLAASAIKRNKNIKDYSQLIPGHGGMFDRADSLLFSIPAAYICLHIAGLGM